jgi:DNA (cytosine-5)-methyltransferase 1
MLHLGDITRVHGSEVPPVDVIIGGSPCQDLSIAGKRAGLAGERSGLFMEQIRIIKEMRQNASRTDTVNGIRPRYMVWENVSGAFSSASGEDFRAVLEETARVVDKDAVIPRPPKGKWTNAGCVVGDGWSIAWRVFDAQFWGVPQRRRRIALVADFGGHTAPEILFERESLRGHSAESGKSWKGATGSVKDGTGTTGGDCLVPRYKQAACIPSADSIWHNLIDNNGGGQSRDAVLTYDARGNGDGQTVNTITGDHNNRITDFTALAVDIYPTYCIQGNAIDRADTAGCNGRGWTEDVSYTLNTIDRPAVLPIVYSFDSLSSNSMKSSNPHSGCREVDISKTLDCFDPNPSKNQGGIAIVQPTMFAMQGFGGYIPSQRASTIKARDYKDATDLVCDNVAYGIDRAAFNQGENAQYKPAIERELQPTLTSRGPGAVSAVDCRNGTEDADINGTLQAKSNGGISYNLNNVVRLNHNVRRLTPLECERLQGYPDGWTDIGEWIDSKGKKHNTSDSNRYKSLGNSIALPPWYWLLNRLSTHFTYAPTMASLFDGIGGFPFIWENINGEGSCLWSSEIDDFCIAVTKRRINHEINTISGIN